jgi:hypothetical protein
VDEAHDIPAATRELRADLLAYRKEPPDLFSRNCGRLARMGVPPLIALLIRRLKARIAALIQGNTR